RQRSSPAADHRRWQRTEHSEFRPELFASRSHTLATAARTRARDGGDQPLGTGNAELVQSFPGKQKLSSTGIDRDHHDDDWYFADSFGGGERMGTRHHGSDDGDPGYYPGISAR